MTGLTDFLAHPAPVSVAELLGLVIVAFIVGVALGIEHREEPD